MHKCNLNVCGGSDTPVDYRYTVSDCKLDRKRSVYRARASIQSNLPKHANNEYITTFTMETENCRLNLTKPDKVHTYRREL